MGLSIATRPAEESDLPAILGIYNHYVQHTAATFEVVPPQVADRTAWFEAHTRGGTHRLLVATDDERELRGWASTSEFRPRAAYATTVEASVYCRPDSTGEGVGTRLYADLFRSIQAEDLERIVAGVTLPNPASLRLHRQFGFREVGTFTRIGRKFGQFWDVCWLERPLRIGSPETVAGRATPL